MHSSRIKKANTEDKNFYSEIGESIDGYVADKLNIVFAEKSISEIISLLAERSAKQDTIKKYSDLRSELDIARFAPVSGSESMQSREKIKEVAASIIKAFETTLKER
jgi:virulence-associated protein VapD